MSDMMNLISTVILPALAVEESEKNAAPAADHWALPVLKERVAYLKKLAAYSEGAAGEPLKNYPRHAAMLSVRSRDGEAEAHANFADIFIVLDGRATLVTGGVIEEPRTVGSGEIRGTSVKGGAALELRPGDVAHVPAGVPHQMLVPGEQGFSVMVVKVQEIG